MFYYFYYNCYYAARLRWISLEMLITIMSKKQSKITRSGQGLAGPKRLVPVPPYAVRACIVPRDIAIEMLYPKLCIIIDHLPFVDGDRRLQEERRGQRSENRSNPSPRPRNFWATTKLDERRGIESKKTRKTSHKETTCSTRNHDRPARRGKSRRKRAARNWKRGSTERMQRFIPRDGLLPGKKYRQEDRGQARNRVKTDL